MTRPLALLKPGHRRTDRAVAHYELLAPRYDHRWQAYLHTTLRRLLGTLALSGGERVLDIGCGTGEFERLAIAQVSSLTLVGLDATQAMATIARKKLAGDPAITLLIGEAEALPFGPEEFDVVVSANSLHHLRDVGCCLTEWLRVLRPGGQLAIVDWCRDFWHCRLYHYWLRRADPTYVQMYRLGEMCRSLQDAGVSTQYACRFIAPPGYGMLCVKGVKGPTPCGPIRADSTA